MLSPASLFQLASGLVTATKSKAGTQMPRALPNPYNEKLMQSQWDLQNQNINQHQSLVEQQSKLNIDTGVRDAQIEGRDIQQFASSQAHAYNSSGVMLEGTPLQVLENTRILGQQKIDAGMAHTIAISNLIRQNGLIQQNESRAQLLGQQSNFAMDRARFDAQQALDRIGNIPQNSPAGNFLRSLGNILPNYSGPAARPLKRAPYQVKDPATLDPNFTDPNSGNQQTPMDPLDPFFAPPDPNYSPLVPQPQYKKPGAPITPAHGTLP